MAENKLNGNLWRGVEIGFMLLLAIIGFFVRDWMVEVRSSVEKSNQQFQEFRAKDFKEMSDKVESIKITTATQAKDVERNDKRIEKLETKIYK